MKARGIEDADDIAAVLHARLARATGQASRVGRVRRPVPLIAGLLAPAMGPMPDDMRIALQERRDLIEQRADALVASAVHASAPWLTELGTPPRDRLPLREWQRAARVVAAYRDRHGISDGTALGSVMSSAAEHGDGVHARAALLRARQVAADASAAESPARTLAKAAGPRL